MFQNILVAIDGSAPSATALKAAQDLASTLRARLTLLTAYDDPRDAGTFSPAIGVSVAAPTSPAAAQTANSNREYAEQLLQQARAQLGPDVPCELVVVEGRPAEQIRAQVESGGHDLVVMGSRGHGPIGALIVGSVSSDVLHHSGVPVLVVP